MKILWVKSGPLFPLNTGGRRRTHAMLVELAKKHHITWLAMLVEGRDLAENEQEASYAQEKYWIPTTETKENSLSFYAELAKNFLYSSQPYTLDKYKNSQLAEKIVELDENGDFDLIICDFLYPALNFDLHRLSTPTVLFQHNVEAQIWKRLVQEKKNPISRIYFHDQFRRMWSSEKILSGYFDGVITVSEEDTELCRKEYQLENLLGAVPTGIDANYFQPPRGGRRPEKGVIGFLGSMDWMPNIESVRYFVKEIFPLLTNRHPGARFKIIGRDPGPAVLQLADENPIVEVTGTVDDVRPHLDSCELLVVPLRSGGGTRIKIFEAMAQGVPVVSTTIGAEGLPVSHEETILIADDPQNFATEVSRLLDSPDLGTKLSQNAREMLVANHSWESVGSTFIDLCSHVTN